MADTSDNKNKITPSDMQEEATRPATGQVLPPEEAAQPLKPTAGAGAAPSMSDLDTLKLLSEQTGLPYVELATFEIDLNLTKQVPYHIANSYKIFPLKEEADGSILVALSDPMNINVLDELRLVLDRPVSGAIAREEDISDAINMYYGLGDENLDAVVDKLHEENTEENIVNTGDQIDLTNLSEIDQDAPVKKYVNLLLLQAIKDRASDLHIEPFEDMLRIRYRIDGVLHEVSAPPKHLHLGIQSRLKVMAGMDISERRLPQDGRIKLNLAGRQIDLRVSSLPTVWGESIVLRILDKSMMMMGLEQIGLLPEVHDKCKTIIDKPNGIILVTGPTGCGKTTTLYSMLNEIYTPELKVITNEDPVEYEMEGVVQVNIKEALGLTFASCLRAILRQDPDVIMVGEIRDPTTAQISIQAALTGHLVLSTLHTNDAPSTVTRLIDMEVEPFLLSSTLEGVLAQRLVRTICPNCREEYTPPDQLMIEMNMKPEDAKQYTFYHGRGCEDCNYTGYKGRIGIFELLSIDDDIRNLILQRASTGDITRKARANGMMTMRQDGWQKVLAGITTLDEILRVTFGFDESASQASEDRLSEEMVETPVVAVKPAVQESGSLGDADFVQKEDNSTGEEADRA
jgi:type II secretion system protein E